MDTPSPLTAQSYSAFDLSTLVVSNVPFVHVINDQFIRPDLYQQLCDSFPTCPPRIGPTGFALYWGDERYDRLVTTNDAWSRLFSTFQSQAFIDWCLEQFADVWQAENCGIDLSKARYVQYREDRIDKERATLRKVEHAPDDLWVRMDIHQGQIGYDRPIHLDHARRLLSMYVYICDPSENEMAGGDLLLHSDQKNSKPAARISPRHNLMVAFPSTIRSFHSVSKVTSQQAPRNYIQVHVSSSVDIWPRPAIPLRRQRLMAFKRRMFTK